MSAGQTCAACKRAGPEAEARCTHPASNRPPWKPDSGASKVKAIYGTAHAALYQQEARGMMVDDDNAVFKKMYLDRWFMSPPCVEPHPLVETVFLCLDPNGGRAGEAAGADNSAAALVSLFYQGGNIVVSFSASSSASIVSLTRASESGTTCDSMRSASACLAAISTHSVSNDAAADG